MNAPEHDGRDPAELLAAEATAWLAASDAVQEARAERERLAASTVHHPHTEADQRAHREASEHEAREELAAERARLAGLNVHSISPRTWEQHPFGVMDGEGHVIAAARTLDAAEQLARKLLALPGSPRGPLVLYVVRLDDQGKPASRVLRHVRTDPR